VNVSNPVVVTAIDAVDVNLDDSADEDTNPLYTFVTIRVSPRELVVAVKYVPAVALIVSIIAVAADAVIFGLSAVVYEEVCTSSK